MRALGIDPGSNRSAFAVLDGAMWPPRYLAGGMVDSTRPALRALLAAHPHERLAIEKHGLVFRVEGASAMVQSSDVAGIVYGLEPLDEPYIQRLEAVDVRTELNMGRSPSDAKVKEVVTGNCRGLPARTNAHVRDAVAVALAALWRIRTHRAPCCRLRDVSATLPLTTQASTD